LKPSLITASSSAARARTARLRAEKNPGTEFFRRLSRRFVLLGRTLAPDCEKIHPESIKTASMMLFRGKDAPA
jgi:hypothetical protein